MALDVELSEVRDFLAEHAPFDSLPPTRAGRSTRRSSRWSTSVGAARSWPRAARTTTSTSCGRGPSTSSTRPGTLVDRGEAGTCFGSISLLGANPSTFVVTTIEDTLTLVMDAETFFRLRRDYRDFEHFFDEQRAHRMRGAVGTQQLSTTGSRHPEDPGSRAAQPRGHHHDDPGLDPRRRPRRCPEATSPRCLSWTASASPASSPTGTCAAGCSRPGWTRSGQSPRS